MAAAENFAKLLTPQLEEERKKFRFVYCSGTFAVVDQEKSLWFMGEGRRVKVSFSVWIEFNSPNARASLSVGDLAFSMK